MKVGVHLTPFFGPGGRAPADVIDEALAVGRRADELSFDWVSVPHHWAAHPVVWPQPFPLLAGLARETRSARLMTLMLLLPLLSPVDVAENVATIDQMSGGRFTLGAAIGFRDVELMALKLTRKDRVPKLEESIEVMSRLWSGEEVSFEGRYGTLQRMRTALLPAQRPRPPIILGAQSEAATRRAARIADGVYLGPQVTWKGLRHLIGVYRDARREAGHADEGIIGAGRVVLVGRDREDAARTTRPKLEALFANYQRWEMKENGMVPIALSFDTPLEDWTVAGSPADCSATLAWMAQECGITHVGLNIYSLPGSRSGRLEHVEHIATDVVTRKVREA
ncbi:MAG TPA: LLM class flavin-dependent oxidoreductase [Methylomirabilota bacterium]|jgi:alkanesulfonate monooxygenase SsuD/methylene tetrahydromethanopterin reductase-like flavin-dependent oxidoreductase (luciferase family)